MIKLSYSSLKYLNGEANHEWINKMLGIPVPNYPFLAEGKEAHRIIQDHVSGKKKHKLLSHIEITFPIVEEKDFDERCKFQEEFCIGNERYLIIGFLDGLDKKNKRLLEIKTGKSLWSLKKFKDDMQRKLYAWAFPYFTEVYLITGGRTVEDWKNEKPKVYTIPLTKDDRNEACDWIKKGIEILKSGKFTGGLDENGKCTGCFYNNFRYPELANCNFI